MTPTRIEARECGRTWPDGTRALHPLELTVEPAETLVLLGPSGCGKTTLLRILAGLDRPDPPGRVLYGGMDVTRLPIERRGVGMVFQSYALFPNMSVAGNVGYGPRLRGARGAALQATVGRHLTLCRIEALADRHIDQLSGGQRQRVALARALAAEPRALFLDEPLTALDASLREALRDEIADLLRGLGVTAVYVTHDQAEAMALADRIVVMSEGRIEQTGMPADIYERPANRFVASFVGETNRLPGDPSALFRPEAARLVAPGAPGSLSGRVESLVYLGRTSRLRVRVGDETLAVYAPGTSTFATGELVGVAVDAGALIRPGERSTEFVA